jgi:lysophospholipase L1-like esterase
MADDDDLPISRKIAFSAAGLFLLLVVLCVLAAIGELVMRAIGPRSDGQQLGVRYDDSARLYGLKPNARALQTGVLVQTNSLGFRENEYPLERPSDTRRIVVLGDSYTFGLGVEFGQTYGKQLEARMSRALGPTEVINFGVSGYNTLQELATLREIAARYRPDLIIVGFVLNDVERARPVTKAHPASAWSPLGAHNALKRHSMLYRYVSPKIGAVFALFGARYAFGMTHNLIDSYTGASPGWAEVREALLGIAEEARKLQAGMLVVVFPMMVDFRTYPLEHAHRAVMHFCQDNGIEALDLLARFRDQNAAELAVFLDGHPNGRAHGIFADEIYRYLARATPAARSVPVGGEANTAGRSAD